MKISLPDNKCDENVAVGEANHGTNLGTDASMAVENNIGGYHVEAPRKLNFVSQRSSQIGCRTRFKNWSQLGNKLEAEKVDRESCQKFKTANELLKKNAKDPYLAPLVYRFTPLGSGHSAAQLLMGKSSWGRLQMLEEQLVCCVKGVM